MNLSHFFHRCALPVNWSSSPCLANGEHDARSVSAMFATTVSERYEITLRVGQCNVCNELSWHDWSKCTLIQSVFQMNIPTEHFQNIPVHTLSPIPLSPETLDLLKVYER